MLTELAHVDPTQVELVEVIGRLDSEKGQALAQALSEIVDRHRTHIILDLSRVDYMNSMGLRELFFALRRAQACGVRLYVVNPSERVRTLLELVGLDGIVPICDGSSWDLTQLPAPHRAALYHQTHYC